MSNADVSALLVLAFFVDPDLLPPFFEFRFSSLLSSLSSFCLWSMKRWVEQRGGNTSEWSSGQMSRHDGEQVVIWQQIGGDAVVRKNRGGDTVAEDTKA